MPHPVWAYTGAGMGDASLSINWQLGQIPANGSIVSIPNGTGGCDLTKISGLTSLSSLAIEPDTTNPNKQVAFLDSGTGAGTIGELHQDCGELLIGNDVTVTSYLVGAGGKVMLGGYASGIPLFKVAGTIPSSVPSGKTWQMGLPSQWVTVLDLSGTLTLKGQDMDIGNSTTAGTVHMKNGSQIGLVSGYTPDINIAVLGRLDNDGGYAGSCTIAPKINNAGSGATIGGVNYGIEFQPSNGASIALGDFTVNTGAVENEANSDIHLWTYCVWNAGTSLFDNYGNFYTPASRNNNIAPVGNPVKVIANTFVTRDSGVVDTRTGANTAVTTLTIDGDWDLTTAVIKCDYVYKASPMAVALGTITCTGTITFNDLASTFQAWENSISKMTNAAVNYPLVESPNNAFAGTGFFQSVTVPSPHSYSYNSSGKSLDWVP